jgi:2,3-dihydroxy-p-cumate/2,3-dihydroxybenzoate 3,4-dioxygenase
MSIALEQLRYVRLGVQNLKTGTSFARDILGLECSSSTDTTAYFKSDFREYTLCFVEGGCEPAIALDVRTADALSEARLLLQSEGYAVRDGSETECRDRKVKAFFTFPDNSGNFIEIVLRPLVSGWRYFPARDTGVTGLQSVALRTTAPEKDKDLWTRILGGRVSDWIGDGPQIRFDASHHRISLHPSHKRGILSIAYAVEGINQVMQSQYFLRDNQYRIAHGPGREATSEQIFITFEGPGDVYFSFVTQGLSIADDGKHAPRQFPMTPKSFCSWGSETTVPEFGGIGTPSPTAKPAGKV